MAEKGNSDDPARKYEDESKDHKKQEMKKKYGRKYLEAKAKLDEEITAPEEEPALPNKKQKPKSEKDVSSENSEDENIYTCELCRKICTSFLNYQLHIEGKKHHKNLLKENMMKNMKDKYWNPNTSEEKPPEEESLMCRVMTNYRFASCDILCKLCQKKCCGPKAFQQHCDGAGHKKKEAAKAIENQMKSKSVSPQQHGDEPPFYAHCHVCQKDFSGPIPFQQHMESNTHLKQVRHVEQLSNIKGLIISSDDDSKNFHCKECGKEFSGPVPFEQHILSNSHEKLKKKNDRIEALQKKHPELVKVPVQHDSETADSDEENGSGLGCKVCRVVFSGPEAAKDHFDSAKHKKAVKKKEQFQKYRKQQNAKELEASGSKGRIKTENNDPQETDSSDESGFDIIPQV